jgi:hypothetical protein
MTSDKEPYLAYLLRLWPVEVREKVSWRASLQRVGDDDRRGFEDLESLFNYLREETRDRGLVDPN